MLTHTQQAGFAALAALMALGFIGLLFVRGGGPLGGSDMLAWTEGAAAPVHGP